MVKCKSRVRYLYFETQKRGQRVDYKANDTKTVSIQTKISSLTERRAIYL